MSIEERQAQQGVEDLGDLSNFQAAPTDFNVRRRRKPKALAKTGSLTITSLMDILTILLVFLLKNYAASPVNINQEPGLLQLPTSSAKLAPEEAVPISITARNITVNDKAVAEVIDGKVDPAVKRDGEKGFFITPVYDALASEADKQRRIAKHNSAQQFKGLALVIADRNTPYRLLNEVLYTAGQAQFGQFKFAVVKGSE